MRGMGVDIKPGYCERSRGVGRFEDPDAGFELATRRDVREVVEHADTQNLKHGSPDF